MKFPDLIPLPLLRPQLVKQSKPAFDQNPMQTCKDDSESWAEGSSSSVQPSMQTASKLADLRSGYWTGGCLAPVHYPKASMYRHPLASRTHFGPRYMKSNGNPKRSSSSRMAVA